MHWRRFPLAQRAHPKVTCPVSEAAAANPPSSTACQRARIENSHAHLLRKTYAPARRLPRQKFRPSVGKNRCSYRRACLLMADKYIMSIRVRLVEFKQEPALYAVPPPSGRAHPR
jgi:hypothetical protein